MTDCSNVLLAFRDAMVREESSTLISRKKGTMRRNRVPSALLVVALLILALPLVFFLRRLSPKIIQTRTTKVPEMMRDIGRHSLDSLFAGDREVIFFLETADTKTEFHPKYLCAFEAAAVKNPDKKVRQTRGNSSIDRRRRQWLNT